MGFQVSPGVEVKEVDLTNIVPGFYNYWCVCTFEKV